MQGTNVRTLILTAVLFAGALALVVGGRSASAASNASWPAVNDPAYDVAGWVGGPIVIAHEYGVAFVSRTYRSVDGTFAYLTLATSPEAKRVYNAGAEVPLLGSGYSVESLVSGELRPGAYSTALMARKDNATLLVYAAYGQRRGLVGNGIAGWALVILDGLLDRPNYYFMLKLTVPGRADDARVLASAAGLADEVFPRLARWYGR
jgi:hypothetical protein